MRARFLPLLALGLAFGQDLGNIEVARVLGKPVLFREIEPPMAAMAAFAASHSDNETAAWILSMRAARLSQFVLLPMAEAFLKHQPATPLPDELAALRAAHFDVYGKTTLTDLELLAWWRTWKMNQLLHAEFGGKVVRREFGLEAVEALGHYLALQEKSGGLSIPEPVLRNAVFHYFTNQTMHVWYEGNPRPWMRNAAQALRLAAD